MTRKTIGPIAASSLVGALVTVVVLLLSGSCARGADAGTPRHGSPAPAVSRIRDAGRARQDSPDTGLRTLDIEAIRREIKKATGHVLFVHLWASWCGPCLDELPLIDRFARAVRARGAVVLSVSLDTDYRGIARVPAVLRARAPGLTAAVAHFDDPDQFMSLFSKSWEGTIPALFAFDRTGRLRKSLIGEVEPADLELFIAELLPPPPPSR